MIDRRELVTAALLGTDRRRLPAELQGAQDADPAAVLLDWAARSGAAQRAGSVLPRTVPGPSGPAQLLPVAPPAARDLLAKLLLRHQPELVNLWLRTAVRHGFGLAPQHWALLATAAARNTELSRPLVGAALGERGRWFLRQNPQWLRLVVGSAQPSDREPPSPGPIVDEESVRADPEAIFQAPQPWSASLTLVALAAIGSLQLRMRTRRYAVAVGVRLPPEHEHLVRSAAAHYHEHLRPGQGMILVREAFAAVDEAMQTARGIDAAFSTEPAVPEPQQSPCQQ